MVIKRLFINLSLLIVLFVRVIAQDSSPTNLIEELVPSDGDPGDRFGVSASISGDTLAIGAHFKEGTGGAVYIFERNPGETDQWKQAAKLTADDGTPGDSFGWSVAIDGNVLVNLIG